MSEPTEQKKEKKTNYTRQLLKWGAIVLGVWLLYLAVLFWGHYILSIPDSLLQHKEIIGVFGDYFGALNALFAGLAFAGIIVTIRQQSADLQATKEEMEEQTDQFARQTELIQKQIAKQEQNFREQRYFNLIDRLENLRVATEANYSSEQYLSNFKMFVYEYCRGGVKPGDNSKAGESRLDNFIRIHYAWSFVFKQAFALMCSMAKDKQITDDERRDLVSILKSGFNMLELQIFKIIEINFEKKINQYEDARNIVNDFLSLWSKDDIIEFLAEAIRQAFVDNNQKIPDKTKCDEIAKQFLQLIYDGEWDAMEKGWQAS